MYRELITRVISFISENELIVSGEKILIAVSGGIDSMLLMHVLNDIRSDLDIDIAIAHINHNIRSNSSSDQRFVIDQAKSLQIPICTKQLEFDNSKVKNIEAWARKNRYLKLENIRNELRFNKIATGHHQNDQIETILQRLSEKSGIDGLRGVHKQNGNIIRPLLAITRSEIETVVKELNIQYIDDETNKDETLKRNYFRHQVVPKWEEIYPNLGDSFQAVTENIDEHLNILRFFFEQLKKSIISEETDGRELKINIEKTDILPISVFSSFVKYLLDDGEWRKHQWSELKRILLNAQYGKIYAFSDYEILKDRKEWIIRPKLKVHQEIFNIEVGQLIEAGAYNVSIKEVEKLTINDDPNVEIIDMEKVNDSELIVRYWKDGDVFHPLGMSGKKKVSDYLIDAKINSFEKQTQLVLTSENEIVWLCGHRISEKAKIDDNTKHYLELSIKSNVG